MNCRKLGELGYKRSAEKCKEKYEEETSRNLNGIIGHNNVKLNNKFLISELDEQIFYQDHGDQNNIKPIVRSEEEQPASCDHQEEKMMKAKLQQIIESEEEEEEKEEEEGPKEKENELVDTPPSQEVVIVKPTKSKKRKSREDKFEMLKGFCVEIVHKMIEQQEELHNKLIQEMLNRDEAKIAREEAWKKQEMERVNKEIEIRAHEQVVAGDRQATIIELLNKFTPKKPYPLRINFEDLKQPEDLSPQMATSPSSLVLPEANNSTSFAKNVTKVSQIRRKPTLSSSDEPNPTCTSDAREDIGKRWPRDEVQALINMRCSLYNSNNISNSTSNVNHDDKESSGASSCNKQGGSLWEKISQGMSELGYTRSAKRCKEKWENINKYFRKTKDVNKKRSVDSRTCPYFHQLSSLYNQGALFAPSDEPASHSTSLESHSALPEMLLETAI